MNKIIQLIAIQKALTLLKTTNILILPFLLIFVFVLLLTYHAKFFYKQVNHKIFFACLYIKIVIPCCMDIYILKFFLFFSDNSPRNIVSCPLRTQIPRDFLIYAVVRFHLLLYQKHFFLH